MSPYAWRSVILAVAVRARISNSLLCFRIEHRVKPRNRNQNAATDPDGRDVTSANRLEREATGDSKEPSCFRDGKGRFLRFHLTASR
jgi:hypothetical protein